MKHSLDFCRQVHEANKAKGFWDNPRPVDESLMLIICELAEAVEADREGRRYTNNQLAWRFFLQSPDADYKLAWGDKFRACVKDTVEDELADAYIRICDLIGSYADLGSNFSYFIADPEVFGCIAYVRENDSFCQDMFYMAHSVMVSHASYPDEDGHLFNLVMCLEKLRSICLKHNIDLESHVNWKLKYNAGRPAKHGKAY